jgi:hypothetical protein
MVTVRFYFDKPRMNKYIITHMIINCIFCNTTATVRHNYILMRCMCDDEFRAARVDDIKYGFHSDRVYLLETSTNGDIVYDQTSEFKATF